MADDRNKTPSGGWEISVPADKPLPNFLAEAEAQYLSRVTVEAHGNKRAAAEAAGIPYETFLKKFKRLGLEVRATGVTVVRK